MIKVPREILVGLVIVLAAIVYYFHLWAVSSAPDPQMTMNTLGGLTPDQVIALLGKPRGDSLNEIVTRPTKSSPATSQPAPGDERRTFEYSDTELSHGHFYGHFYGIVFLNNHVSEVIAATN